MSKLRDNLFLAVILTASSAAIYIIQYLTFDRPSETLFYLFQDLAFVPVQALIVTLVINRLLNILEKRKKIKKVNVIISTFFVDTGIKIMMTMSRFNCNHDKVCEIIRIEELISNKESIIQKKIDEFKYNFYADPEGLEELASIMDENKGFLLTMLENPNLLEHDSFTDMLWAVFHVADELKSRGDLRKLSKVDMDHISGDMLRAYTAMVMEWISYIIYLRNEYPYLYVSAVKKNPFCPADTTENA